MRAAQVTEGVVTNVVLVEVPNPDQNEIALPDDSPVSIGWTYDGTDFFPPPPPPPEPGTIPNTELDQRIVTSPSNLFGGPTMQEVFNVYPSNN